MTKLTLAIAEAVAEEVLKAARAAGGAPLAVAVLDEGGHLKLLKREDGTAPLRPDIAIGKAWGAVAMQVPSRTIAHVSNQNPQFVAALTTLSGGRILPNAGGVLIRNEAGELLGAAGVSGDTPDNDEAFAIQGIKTAGLQSDPA